MCGPADNLYTLGAKLNKVGKQMVESLIGEGWASRYAGKRNAAAATGVFTKNLMPPLLQSTQGRCNFWPPSKRTRESERISLLEISHACISALLLIKYG
jgi:hypothetical protein